MDSNDPTDGPYKVGRGRPPLHSRFKKGQSGNPRGRQRGCLNLKTIFEKVMANQVMISFNGQQQRVVLPEAVILSQTQQALKGSTKAAEHLLNRYERLGIGDDGVRHHGLPDEDRIILERAMQRMETSEADEPPGCGSDDDEGGDA